MCDAPGTRANRGGGFLRIYKKNLKESFCREWLGMTTMRRTTSRTEPGSSSSKCSRMACRRVPAARRDGGSLGGSHSLHRNRATDGARQQFTMKDQGGYLESVEEIPEPCVRGACASRRGQLSRVFNEHEHAHGSAHRDNNMRAAVIHVIADAAMSVLVIVGLLLARF
jgi:hypothetical protein